MNNPGSQDIAPKNPKRGEVWLVNLDPTVGSEIKKTRPSVVISSDIIARRLDCRIVIPVTTWQNKFEAHINKIKIPKTEFNGLEKDSAADVLQVRCVSVNRFVRKLGVVSNEVLAELVAGVAVMIDYS
jgi:mRNA interferase MazF